MNEEELQMLYSWIDEIPLSRPKRNITRDFSDGVLVAEVCAHFVPKLVELHNYSPASSGKQKVANWQTLTNKVFKKIGLVVPENVINGVIACKPGVVEVVLNNLRIKLDQFLQRQSVGLDTPPVDHSDWGDLAPPPPQRKEKSTVSQSGKSLSSKQASTLSPGRADPDFGGHNPINGPSYEEIDDPINAMMEKDQSIMDYQETVDILHVKVRKLEQLVKLKDRRIEELTKKLKAAGIQP